MGKRVNASELIKQLCNEKKISQAELAMGIEQPLQKFNKKFRRGTVSTEELVVVGEKLGVVFEQPYILENGEKLSISSES